MLYSVRGHVHGDPSCGQIGGLKLIFRRTTERITELRDLFDELDDLIRKVKRHQAHMGGASDEKTKKMLRTSIKNVVRNISYLSNSVSLKNNTNKGPIHGSYNQLKRVVRRTRGWKL